VKYTDVKSGRYAFSPLFLHSICARGIFLLCLASVAVAQNHTPSPSANGFATLSAKADAARDADQLDAAIPLYKRALALRPSWAEGWWSLGTIYYDRNAYAKASFDFQKLIALQPENGTAQALFGLCEFELGHEKSALRHIQLGEKLGLQKNSDLWHVVLYHESVLLQRQGSFQSAQDTLEELCLQTGANDQAANVLGMAMLRLNSQSPPASDSADAPVVLRVGRAECLAGQKKYDEAKPLFEELVREYPKYPNIHYAFGLFLVQTRDVSKAVEQFKQEIQNRPDDVISRLRIAATDYKEDSAAGIPYAEEAVQIAPQQPFGHYLLGLLQLDVDNYERAIPELELAQKGLPREARLYAALASAYSRAGRRQEAAKARAIFGRLNHEQAKGSEANARSSGEAGDARNPLTDSVSLPQ
jgi:tetratricopeptide (TPR) repeat protein